VIGSKSENLPVQGSGSGDAEEAIDTLAHLLRVFGEYGFDTANIDAPRARADLEAWARHILVGSDPPGVAKASDRDGSRDWKGLCRYATEKRRDEVDYVIQSSSDLRAALWSFIQGMARAVPEDQGSNKSVMLQLDQLRACLSSNETSEIRRLAGASIDAIDGEIRERIERDRCRIEEIATRVVRVSDELTSACETLERDPLTGLYDRAAFEEYFTKVTHLGMLSAQSHTLFLMDIDDFKWVNDRVGQSIGDVVLKEVASSLLLGFGRRGDFVARYGGDELAVVVQTQGESVDRQIGEEALHRVRNLSIPDGDEQIRVSLSIGTSRLRCGEHSDEWLARSDRALHAAKERGKDRLVCESDFGESES